MRFCFVILSCFAVPTGTSNFLLNLSSYKTRVSDTIMDVGAPEDCRKLQDALEASNGHCSATCFCGQEVR